jgi:hypothetical protein
VPCLCGVQNKDYFELGIRTRKHDLPPAMVFKSYTTGDFHLRRKFYFALKLVNIILINHVCIFSTVTKIIVVWKFEHNPGVTSLTNLHMALSFAGQYHWSLPASCSIGQNRGWHILTQASMSSYRSHNGETHPTLVFSDVSFHLSGHVIWKNRRY